VSCVSGKEVGHPKVVLSATERWRGMIVAALANIHILARRDDRIHFFNSDSDVQIRGIDVRGDHTRENSRAARGRVGVELTLRGRGNSGCSGEANLQKSTMDPTRKGKSVNGRNSGCALQSQTMRNHLWGSSQWQEVNVIAREMMPPIGRHRVAAGLAPCLLSRMH
jgi:hypothetical protein